MSDCDIPSHSTVMQMFNTASLLWCEERLICRTKNVAEQVVAHFSRVLNKDASTEAPILDFRKGMIHQIFHNTWSHPRKKIYIENLSQNSIQKSNTNQRSFDTFHKTAWDSIMLKQIDHSSYCSCNKCLKASLQSLSN